MTHLGLNVFEKDYPQRSLTDVLVHTSAFYPR